MADGDAPELSQDLSQQVPLGLSENDYTYAQLVDAHNRAYMGNDANAVTQLRGMIDNKMRTMQQTATESMGPGERFARSYANVLPRTLEGLANWTGLKGTFGLAEPTDLGSEMGGVQAQPRTRQIFDSTDEALRMQDAATKGLRGTSAGMAGDVTGQAVNQAALALATRGISIPFQTAELGPVGAQVFIRAAQLAEDNPWKAKFLVNSLKTGEAAAQGAVQGGAMAAPGEQAEGAKTGAILNAALGKLGQTGGRALSGIVEKSPAAQALIAAGKEAGQQIFLPISQAAARTGLSGMAKTAYQKILPYALSVEGRLTGQSEAAKEAVREARVNINRPASVPAITGGTPEAQAARLSAAHDQAVKNSFDSHTFNIPFSFDDQVYSTLDKRSPGIPEAYRGQLADIISKATYDAGGKGEYGAQLTGANLRAAMTKAQTQMDALGPHIEDKWKDSALQSMRDIVDQEILENQNIIKLNRNTSDVRNATKFLSDMDDYQALAKKDPAVRGIVKATEATPETRGAYNFKDALQYAQRGTPDYDLLQNAHEVLSQNPAQVSPTGRHMLHLIGGPAIPGLGFHYGHGEAGLLGPAAFEGGANALSLQGAQNILYGDTAAQKALVDYLRKSPAGARAAGGALRGAVTAEKEER